MQLMLAKRNLFHGESDCKFTNRKRQLKIAPSRDVGVKVSTSKSYHTSGSSRIKVIFTEVNTAAMMTGGMPSLQQLNTGILV